MVPPSIGRNTSSKENLPENFQGEEIEGENETLLGSSAAYQYYRTHQNEKKKDPPQFETPT
jgi:hypothetical protein